MPKVMKYKFLSAEINHGTEAEPDIEQVFLDVEILCENEAALEANLQIAQREAYGGEYVIEESESDGTYEPTQEQRITELEEALALLLSGVTE